MRKIKLPARVFVISVSFQNEGAVLSKVLSPLERLCHNMKNTNFLDRGGGGRVGGLPGSGMSKDNETLPKDFERKPLSIRNKTPQTYENI
jgi:hypothetical protein